MADLTSRTKFKAAYKITTTTKDDEHTLLVAAASEWIEGQLERTFAETEYTELFSPGKSDEYRVDGCRRILRVRNYPIISVTSLKDDTLRAFASASLIDSDDYFINQNGFLVELFEDGLTPSFHFGRRSVQLIYKAGFTTIPQRIETLANVVTFMFHEILDEQSKQGLRSESLGDVTQTFSPDQLPKFAQLIMDEFRRPLGF